MYGIACCCSTYCNPKFAEFILIENLKNAYIYALHKICKDINIHQIDLLCNVYKLNNTYMVHAMFTCSSI